MSNRAAPPLLDTYLGLPPEAALILLTGILGASTNWLVIRFLHSLLSPHRPKQAALLRGDPGEGPGQEAVGVLLVSFLRDHDFWKAGSARLGVDLEALARSGRFRFVDGLTRLFVPGSQAVEMPRSKAPVLTLTRSEPADVKKTLQAALGELQLRWPRTVLVIDGLDLLLAASTVENAGSGVHDMLLGLREHVYATILAVAADEPLLRAQKTSLEREHASMILSLAHKADFVASLRLLDTGLAGDVSGVLRVTRRGGTPQEAESDVEEQDLLYHVSGDGGVKVFERGR